MNRKLIYISLSAIAISPGCVHQREGRQADSSTSIRSTSGSPVATPLFDGMGEHHRKTATSSNQAQQYFDQGLIWTFAFNHDEAIRSFRQAATLDPECAMAWWGIALANGPHINNTAMPPERSKTAWEALQKAVTLKTAASDAERSLIDALTHRYADPPPHDRKLLDEDYAKAMRRVWTTHSKDADIGVLYAEAMMDLRPWDLWTHDGRPQPGTQEIISVLEEVLKLDAHHVGALHLLIHAVEASPHPEKALFAADRLRDLVPVSGHLVHMPAHIYARVGRWGDAADANVRAMEADGRYRALSPDQGFYHVYMAHNAHFLSWVSMMQGRSAAAKRAARQLIEAVPPDYAKANAALMDGFFSIELEVMMRFGEWDMILDQSAPSDYFPITTAFWRFARGVAFAAKDDVHSAQREHEELQRIIKRIPDDTPLGNNLAHDCLTIATHVLKGEIALAGGEMDDAIVHLREGAKHEDVLRYNEAPDWIQPVRHALGAVLLRANRAKEAEQVYRDDLARWPENGWSLHGLSQALRAVGSNAQADQVEERFRHAWAEADVPIRASCLCAIGREKS